MSDHDGHDHDHKHDHGHGDDDDQSMDELIDLTEAVGIARSGLRSDVQALIDALAQGELFVPLAEDIAEAPEGEVIEVEQEVSFRPHMVLDEDQNMFCVAYTDPEVAWVGVTESEAKAAGTDYGVGRFPWTASGRALGLDRAEGFTKLLFDRATGRIIGAGIVGPHAGDLIAECALAIEMGCEAADISRTVHPHPTLSESIAFAAEGFEGTVTDLYIPKRR